ELLRFLREGGDAPAVVVLDPRRHVSCVRQAEPASQPRLTQTAWELQERQWIAARLGNDAVKDAIVETTVHRGLEQGTRVLSGKPLQPHLAEARELGA